MFFFFNRNRQESFHEPPIFYGTVLHPKKKSPKRQKFNQIKIKKYVKLSALLFALGILTILIGVLACVYTLYVHDQLFDWVVYSTVIIAVLFIFSALITGFYTLLSK